MESLESPLKHVKTLAPYFVGFSLAVATELLLRELCFVPEKYLLCDVHLVFPDACTGKDTAVY